jgi:hypothetical protein
VRPGIDRSDTGKYLAIEGASMTDDVYQTGERETAPMQAYGMREVAIGLIVLLVGLAVAYAIPALFAGV